MREISNHAKAAAGLLAFVLFLSGCGTVKVPDTIEETSIVVSKEGRIISHTVGVFDRDYYDLDGLRKMAQEEVAAYNTAHQKGTTVPVSVERVEALAGQQNKIVVTYDYESADTYTAYHDEQMFYGTVGQAVESGFPFVQSVQVLRATQGSQTITSAELKNANYSKRHILITTAKAVIYCPYKVEFVSEQVAVREDGGVSTLGSENGDELVIILMNK